MGTLNKIFVVSFITFISRILGLVRDMMITAELGTDYIHSAYISAFTLPNLFRRLLGEGALTSALVPVFSDEVHVSGLQPAFKLLNKVITWLTLMLVTLVALGMLLMYHLSKIEGFESRWYYVFSFSMMLLPYMIFVCLTAVFSAALNVMGRYFLPAMSAAWLNLSMIAVLGLFCTSASSRLNVVYWLIAGVIVGGVIQLSVPIGQLYAIGWRPRISIYISPPFYRILKLFMPGLIGASIMQINIAVSRLLAFNISDSAVSILYLANRLVELPLGMFVIAITTVIFPDLSQFASKGDDSKLADAFGRGVNLILTIVMPATVGLLVLRHEILMILFEWGNFGQRDVLQVVPVLGVLALAMPFYALSTFFTRGFHSLKNTKTPVWISLVNFAVNIFATLVLMGPFGVVGIAYANLLSVVIQTILLYIFLVKMNEAFRLTGFLYPSFVIFSASCFMGLVVFGCIAYSEGMFGQGKLYSLVSVLIGIFFGIISYFMMLRILGMDKFSGKVWAFLVKKFRNW
ncbi:MAG: murein biosynthesis integral membrane protein MurJ [Puniceicoccales bacterium]|nr:murein biosynthesis integral membrane protein MurJ [Puniceicoccales bacterium]